MGSLLAALGVVLVAELGDKTQLVALGFGARYRLAPVLAGMVAAYAATTLLSVLVGGTLGAAFPTRVVEVAGGVLFLGFGAWTFWGPGRSAADAGVDNLEVAPPPRPWRSVVLPVAATMFVAELGDKTMVATATLAARGDPVLVWIGATLGIVLSGLLGVLLGRAFGARLPERATRIGSAALFAVFGGALIVTNLGSA